MTQSKIVAKLFDIELPALGGEHEFYQSKRNEFRTVYYC